MFHLLTFRYMSSPSHVLQRRPPAEVLVQRGWTGRMICTQPRRLSATSVAERVAAERGDRCAPQKPTKSGRNVGKNKLVKEMFAII